MIKAKFNEKCWPAMYPYLPPKVSLISDTNFRHDKIGIVNVRIFFKGTVSPCNKLISEKK